MKERCSLAFMLVFLSLATFMAELVTPVVASSDVIRVPEDYRTIREGIRCASPGDTIVVHEGLYTEGAIYVSKPLTLIAEGRVIVDALYSYTDGFVVTSDDVIIKGFTAKNALYDGICLWRVHNCQIEANTVINNHVGISIQGCNNRVEGNNLSNNTVGISLFGMFYTTRRNVLKENVVRNNSVGIEIFYSHYNIVEENTAANNEKWGIALDFSRYNIVKENTVANNDEFGIVLLVSHYNFIQENSATENFDGIIFSGSGWNVVKENKVKKNTHYGIAMYWSYACNTIKENVALGNEEFDLYWDGTGYNIWTKNKYKTKNW